MRRMLHGRRAGLALVLLVGLLLIGDLWVDLQAGFGSWHVALELAGGAALGLGVLGLTHRLWRSHQRERQLEARIRELWQANGSKQTARRDLGTLMGACFSEWNLTGAEREVASLMLKGLRHKEIAQLRATSERTVRQQALAVYRKAGVEGRTELAGLFLARLQSTG